MVFLLLLFILAKTAWPAILKTVEERERKIKAQLDDAAKANAEAQRVLSVYQQQLAAAREEAGAIVAAGRQAGDRLREDLVAKGRAEQEELLVRARREIGLEKDKALGELRREAVELSIAAASKVIERNMDTRDRPAPGAGLPRPPRDDPVASRHRRAQLRRGAPRPRPAAGRGGRVRRAPRRGGGRGEHGALPRRGAGLPPRAEAAQEAAPPGGAGGARAAGVRRVPGGGGAARQAGAPRRHLRGVRAAGGPAPQARPRRRRDGARRGPRARPRPSRRHWCGWRGRRSCPTSAPTPGFWVA